MPSGLNALIEASEQTKAKFYLSALICLGTEHGVSRQEALSLKLKDLDLDYDGIGLMYLHRTKNGMDRTSSSCQSVGLEGFHFHDLRHTYCSNLRLIGADLHDVKEMIGHQDMAMTDRHAHIGGERKFLLQKQLAEHYAAVSKTKDRVIQ